MSKQRRHQSFIKHKVCSKILRHIISYTKIRKFKQTHLSLKFSGKYTRQEVSKFRNLFLMTILIFFGNTGKSIPMSNTFFEAFTVVVESRFLSFRAVMLWSKFPSIDTSLLVDSIFSVVLLFVCILLYMYTVLYFVTVTVTYSALPRPV